MYAQVKGTHRLYAVVDLADLGRGIAAAYMRDEAPSGDQIAELDGVHEILQAVALHREDQQQAQTSETR